MTWWWKRTRSLSIRYGTIEGKAQLFDARLMPEISRSLVMAVAAGISQAA